MTSASVNMTVERAQTLPPRNLSTLLGHVLGWFIGLGWFPALVG